MKHIIYILMILILVSGCAMRKCNNYSYIPSTMYIPGSLGQPGTVVPTTIPICKEYRDS